MVRLRLLSMMYIFFISFLSCTFFINYWFVTDLFISSILSFRCRIDKYRTTFLNLLGCVAFAVRLWAYYYMDREIEFPRFFTLLIAFITSMVTLIFFSNLFMALIGWDLLGVTSFLLVVFYKTRKCAGSGIITALSNRLGDCFLFCSLAFFFYNNHHIFLSLLLLMSITKRAQLPFRAWLPAAMAAPTPVRALVHSSTLVTAGVYLLIRFCSQDISIMVYVGRCTLVIAGVCACAQRDLKKVVALRTISQIGIIMVTLGGGSKTYCFFHLLSHARFKALLFMCVGVFFHSIFGRQEFRRYNHISAYGWEYHFCAVSTLSLIGFAYTAGFYSKDMILEFLYSENEQSLIIVLYLTGIGLTARYSIKILSGFLLASITGPCFVQGGVSKLVKIPVYRLGILSIVLGSWVESFCGSFFLVISVCDKIMTLFFTFGGVIMGSYITRLCVPFLRRISLLEPSTEYLARAPTIRELNHRDYWLSYFYVPSFLSEHYKVVLLGLSLMLFFIIYVKCHQHFIDINSKQGWGFVNQ